MRLADGEATPLSSVYQALSESEADELMNALSDASGRQGWHAHISGAGYRREITVYREGDETAAF